MAAGDGPLAGFEDLLRQLREAGDALDARAARDAQRYAEQDARRAEAARDGELGPDWRAVQQRLDRGQTTLEDVFSGADDSPHARALREHSRRTLQGLRDEWQAQDEDDTESEPSPAARVAHATAAAEQHRRDVLRQVLGDLQR